MEHCVKCKKEVRDNYFLLPSGYLCDSCAFQIPIVKATCKEVALPTPDK